MLEPPENNPPAANCFNDWDPLEEIVVGRVEGACVPPFDDMIKDSCNFETPIRCTWTPPWSL